ncbi:MAG TPA: hypothetical protein VF406_03230 [Thermodesulfobacteriota bacterium]
MDATTDQIKREIEEARERISENTSQLGERIRQTFDWRQQVGERPWAAVGIAAGAGFVLGAASRRLLGRGMRAASGYGEPYTYDRIGRDVEAQAPGGDGGDWLRGTTIPPAGEPSKEPWGRREAGFEPRAERPREGERPAGGLGRTGAMAGLLASLGTAIEPQLKEIGRTLADQLKDLSTHFIDQSKEVMKQKVDRWRSGSQQPGRGAAQHGEAEGGSEAWSGARAGGSTLSSESAGTPPSGSTGAGSYGSGTPYGSPTTPGVEDVRGTRTPQSRESGTGERRSGGTGSSGV